MPPAAAAAGAGARRRLRPTKKQRNIGSAKRAYIKMQATRVQSQRQIEANKSGEYLSRRRAAQGLYRSQERKRRFGSFAKTVAEGQSIRSAVGTVASPAKPLVNPVLLVLFTWAGIIVLYALISNPQPTSNSMRSLRQWITQLNTTEPLFTLNKE